MSCFHIFKARSGKSSPELRNQEPLSSRVVQSTGLIPLPRSIPEMYKEKEHDLRVFSFAELRNATNNFNRLAKIGEGGFGSVYKGSISPSNGQGDPVMVAIKKLNEHGWQGHKEWLAEVQVLGIVDHPNLVKLIGHCSEDGIGGIQRLLVYEYIPNKSLEDHLFGRASQVLPWVTRLQIILDAAQGLAYLHNGLEVQVIFRDFKSSNVLLDMDFKPKLSDFGLAREGPTGNNTHVSTQPVGTYGYAAPEYIETGHLTTYCDLWSFGVVLYEILTGRRVLDINRPSMEQKLLDWVKMFPVDSKKFSLIIDPRIRNQYSPSAARKIAKIADACLNKNPKERPTMDEVIENLKQAIKVSEETNSTRKSIVEILKQAIQPFRH